MFPSRCTNCPRILCLQKKITGEGNTPLCWVEEEEEAAVFSNFRVAGGLRVKLLLLCLWYKHESTVYYAFKD